MPHVVLKGKVNLEKVFNELDKLFIRNEKQILKTDDMYFERGKNKILIEALAIEQGVKTDFLVMITGREDGLVVRIYPRIEVQKTDGVKKILAEIAKLLKMKFPDLEIKETNLSEYLE